MRTRDVKDVAASIHRRLQNLPDLQQDFQYTLIRYAAERLLYRLSQSPHRDRFVLKGAMLFVIWIGHVPRPTKDVDLLGRSDLGIAELEEVFRGVCSIPCPEDGLAFDVASVRAQEIREEQEYGGIRVTAGSLLAVPRSQSRWMWVSVMPLFRRQPKRSFPPCWILLRPNSVSIPERRLWPRSLKPSSSWGSPRAG